MTLWLNTIINSSI